MRRRWLGVAGLVGALILWLAPSALADQLLETINVDTASSTVTTGAVQLKTGTEYELQVSGTFTLANGYGQSYVEDALYCYEDQGFVTPACAPPARMGDFYIGTGSSSLKNIDAYQQRGGGGSPLSYNVNHTYTVNFFPPANGSLKAGGLLAFTRCKFPPPGSSPCRTAVTGTITIKIYGPSATPPPSPTGAGVTFAAPATAWGAPTPPVKLTPGKSALIPGPPLARGQTSASAAVSGTGVDGLDAIAASSKASRAFCLHFALKLAVPDPKYKPLEITDPFTNRKKLVQQEVQSTGEDATLDFILAWLVCNDAAKKDSSHKAADAAAAAGCHASTTKLTLQELDIRQARYRIAGPGSAPGLTTTCTSTGSGFTIAFQSHGKDLRSLFGPRLMLGLADRSTTRTATAQVTYANGAGSTPPNIGGSWVNKAAPSSGPAWQLTTSNNLQTLDVAWSGGTGHTGLRGAFHGSLATVGGAYVYTGSFTVTEASVTVTGTMSVTIDNVNQIEISLQPTTGSAQHYTFVRMS